MKPLKLVHLALLIGIGLSCFAQEQDSLDVKIKSTLKEAKSLFDSNKKLGEATAFKVYEMAKDRRQNILEFADVHNLIALYKMYGEKYADAETFLDQGMKLAVANDLKTIQEKLRINTALNYMKKGEYQKCITATFEMLPNFKGIPKANALGNIATCYAYLGQDELSIKYQLQALDIYKEFNYKQGIANGYNLIGSAYNKMERVKEAIPYLQESYKMRKEMNDSFSMGNVIINLGKSYYLLKDYRTALKHDQEAEAIFKALGLKEGLAKTYSNIGAVYYKMNDFTKAKEMEKKALELAKQMNDSYLLSYLYENMSRTYTKSNQLDSAVIWKDKALAEKDSLMNLTVQGQIAEMQTKYETVEKEKKIEEQGFQLKEQQFQLKEQQFAISKRNYAIMGVSIFVLLAGLLVWSFGRRYKLKKQQELTEKLHQQQQQATIDILTAEEKERKRIASDLHDGVGQLMTAAWLNLQAVNAQAENNNSEQSQLINKTLQLVDESCKEVRAVSHNMMPNALLKKGLVNAVREFIQQINAKSTSINLQTDGLNKPLPDFVETVLYRVIQESVNNVIKHAQATRLDININQDEEGVDVMIEDNGKGFNIAEAMKKDGIGLQNIQSRIQYLQGTVEWNSSAENGTLVAIHIPPQNS